MHARGVWADGVTRPLVYLITDRRHLAPEARTDAAEDAALEAQIDEAVGAGVSAVQIREPDMAARRLVALVRRIVARRGGRAVPVLVNDRADVARVARADGVHLRARSFPAVRARGLHPDWIVGRSMHVDAPGAFDEAVDYAIVGTVFASASKGPEREPIGLEGLARVIPRIQAPVVAVGGIITPAQAVACLRAGAAGVAGIGMFLPPGHAPGALGAARAVRELTAALQMAG